VPRSYEASRGVQAIQCDPAQPTLTRRLADAIENLQCAPYTAAAALCFLRAQGFTIVKLIAPRLAVWPSGAYY